MDFRHLNKRKQASAESWIASIAIKSRDGYVHEGEVEDGADDDGGEDEVEFVEAEVGARCHVAQNTGRHADHDLAEHLERELRVGAYPAFPSPSKRAQDS